MFEPLHDITQSATTTVYAKATSRFFLKNLKNQEKPSIPKPDESASPPARFAFLGEWLLRLALVKCEFWKALLKTTFQSSMVLVFLFRCYSCCSW